MKEMEVCPPALMERSPSVDSTSSTASSLDNLSLEVVNHLDLAPVSVSENAMVLEPVLEQTARGIFTSTISRRKRSLPQCSISAQELSAQEKCDQGIVQLDVYSLYRSNPKQLLRSRSLSLNAVGSMISSGSNAPYGIEIMGYGRSQRRRHHSSQVADSDVSGGMSANSYVSVNRKPGRRRGNSTTALPTSFLFDGGFGGNSLPSSMGNGSQRSRQRAFSQTLHPSLDLSDFDTYPTVTWSKSAPLDIPPSTEGYDQLSPPEVTTCCTLRLFPMQYLKVKEILTSAWRERGPFKKRDAQRLCRIDVNKTGRLYDWFIALGWLPLPDATIQQSQVIPEPNENQNVGTKTENTNNNLGDKSNFNVNPNEITVQMEE